MGPEMPTRKPEVETASSVFQSSPYSKGFCQKASSYREQQWYVISRYVFTNSLFDGLCPWQCCGSVWPLLWPEVLEVSATPEIYFLQSLFDTIIVDLKLDHMLKGKLRIAYSNQSQKNKVTGMEWHGFYQQLFFLYFHFKNSREDGSI